MKLNNIVRVRRVAYHFFKLSVTLLTSTQRNLLLVILWQINLENTTRMFAKLHSHFTYYVQGKQQFSCEIIKNNGPPWFERTKKQDSLVWTTNKQWASSILDIDTVKLWYYIVRSPKMYKPLIKAKNLTLVRLKCLYWIKSPTKMLHQ